MLNEWRSFLNEEMYPQTKDHNECIKEIQSFLIELGADAGGNEADDLLTILQRPEHSSTCEELAKLCRESHEVLMALCEIKPEVLNVFFSAACSKPRGGSESPLYGPDQDGADDFI